MIRDPQSEPIDVQDSVRLVLANWSRELQTIFRPVLLGPEHDTVLRILPDQLEVFRRSDGGDEPIGTVPWDGKNARPDMRSLGELLDRPGAGRSVVVELPAEAVLRPHLTLPRVNRNALLGALSYEVDRLSPIPAAELYFDFVATGTTTLDIDLRMVRKSVLDKLTTALAAGGLSIQAINFDGDTRSGDWRRFPVNRSAYLRRLLLRYRRVALLGLAILFGLAALIATYMRGLDELSAAADATTEAGIRAARVEKLQHTIDETANGLAFAAQQKQAPLLVGILAEVTRILPDGTWVTELTFDGQTVRLVGSSSSASDLIAIIDRSPQFSGAKFEAPLIHDQTNNTDRFDLSFRLRGR